MLLKNNDLIISTAINQLLEVSEAAFGRSEHWPFFRKVILKRLNDLRRDLNSLAVKREAQNGSDNNHPAR